MKKIIITLLLLPMLASAQYFDVFDIDTSEYPIMKAKFYSIDANGNQILNHSPADFEITENGEPRDVISVSCPEPKNEPFSVVIAVDVSGSMKGEELSTLKNSLNYFIDLIPDDGSEVCIIAFNSSNYFISDFSTNKLKLKSKVDNLNAGGGTDFNAAFINPIAGALLAMEKAKYSERNVIIITDGKASGNENAIINKAKSLGTRIFGILIKNKAPNILQNIFESTQGKGFENIITENDFEKSFIKIKESLNYDPCQISWNNNLTCERILGIDVLNKYLGLKSELTQHLNDSQYLSLEIDKYFINFGTKSKDTTITITSKNGGQTINEIIFVPDNGNYEVLTPLSINIPKNDSVEIEIRFSPIDDAKEYTTMEIIGGYCKTSIGLLKGDDNKPITTKTLSLTHPNGGEVFVAGSDTVITWKGISKNENVIINFSSDEGESWELITKKANNNIIEWIIPSINSDSCLINIDHSVNNFGEIEWEKSYGGNLNDRAYSIIQSNDGGYIVAGYSNSHDGDVSNSIFYSDYWIIKVDNLGNLIWEKTYGGKGNDIAYSIAKTADGGFIVAGVSDSKDGDKSESKGNRDYWVLKLNSEGDKLWENTFGGSKYEVSSSITQTFDGGFIVAGHTQSSDGDISIKKLNHDYWIVKLKGNGELDWEKTYGGSQPEEANSIWQTFDGGFIVAGTSLSNDGDKSESRGGNDIWILKLDNIGNLLWEKSFGGTGGENASCIFQTNDGGFIVAGASSSNDGDKSESRGGSDIWILKLDINGNLLWEKSYGGSSNESANSIWQTFDGGYIVAGSSYSKNGDISEPKGGSYDYWILKLDINGNLLWEKSYGGTGDDRANTIIQTNDGGYLVAGSSESSDGDIRNPKNFSDYWLVKIAPSPPPLQSDTSDAVFSIIMPEPLINVTDIDMGQMIVGNTKDSIVSSVICNNGDAPLHVLGVDITGGDISDFLIPRGAGDFYLEKGQCQDMMFEFTPSALGNRKAVATIRTTIGDFTDTITIHGVGIDPLIEATSEVVDFGKIKLGFAKDTTVFILENKSNHDINITNTSITGPDLEQFEILSTDRAFTVLANEEKDLKLRFVAQYTGRVSSFIEFEYDGAIVPLKSMLFAEGISDVVQTITDTIDFGKVKIGNLKDTNVYIIKNLSSLNISISGLQIIGPDVTQFSIQEVGTDFPIEAYDSLRVKLRFTPTKPGNTSSVIESYNYLTSTRLETMILGNGVGGSVQPMMADAYIGENSYLELHLDGLNTSLLLNIATKFSATVSYNSTLLAPIDKSMSVTTVGNTSFLKIEGELSEVSQIAAIPMKVGLGTAVKSGLLITEFQLYDADGDSVDYDIEPGVGEFNVLGICEEGGTRLLNPTGEVVLIKLQPNSTATQTTAELTLIEEGQTELSIYDVAGNRLKTLFTGIPKPGTKTIDIDTRELSNGRYYVRLTTPTITKTEILEVVR